jgi:nitroreductase
MEVYDAIRTRRSIRKFYSDPIPKEKILGLLEAANMAPTATNRQAWNFLVVSRAYLDQMRGILDSSFKERLSEIGKRDWEEKIKNLPIPLENESEGKVEGLYRFHKSLGSAPFAIVVYVDKESDPWQWKNNICDAAAAIENLLLTACSDGLGACWMTGPLKKKEAEIREFLGIGADKEIVSIIPIGKPAYSPPPPPKVDVKSKTKWLE